MVTVLRRRTNFNVAWQPLNVLCSIPLLSLRHGILLGLCRSGAPVAFERYLSVSLSRGPGHVYCHDLKRYPAILTYYAAGIFGTFDRSSCTVLEDVRSVSGTGTPGGPDFHRQIYCGPCRHLNLCPGIFGDRPPSIGLAFNASQCASERILSFLTPVLAEYVSDDRAVIEAFDRFEYLFSLIHADFRIIYEKQTGKQVLLWAPIRSYAYRNLAWVAPGISPSGIINTRMRHNVIALLNNEIEEQAERWPPLVAGIFGGSLERVQAAVKFMSALFSERKNPV